MNELQYRDLKITFADGKITDYTCSNFEDEAECKKYIKGNVLHNHDTLPLGEFAIGTNTTAYVVAKKYGIEKALLDVDSNNAASWRTMEALGGHMDLEMESELEGHYKVRFYSIDVEKSLKEYSSIYEPMIVSK